MDGDRNERTAEVVPVALRQARAVQARNVGRKKEEMRQPRSLRRYCAARTGAARLSPPTDTRAVIGRVSRSAAHYREGGRHVAVPDRSGTATRVPPTSLR